MKSPNTKLFTRPIQLTHRGIDRALEIAIVVVLTASAVLLISGVATAQVDPTQPPQSASDVLQRLAGVDLLVMVDRDYAQAEAQLQELLAQTLRSPDFAGRDDVTAEVLATWGQLLIDLGRLEEASELLELRRSAARMAGLRVPVATAEEGEEIARVEGLLARITSTHPAFASLLEDLEELQAVTRRAAPDMLTTVRDALASNDEKLLDDLGGRAVPALEELWNPETTGRPHGMDPAYWLVRIDDDRAAELFLEVLEEGRVGNLRRLTDAMKSNNLFGDYAHWLYANNRSPRFLKPAWVDVLVALLDERYVGQDQVGSRILAMVDTLANGDAWTPELTAAVLTLYDSDDDALTQRLYWSHFESNKGRVVMPSWRPLLEALVNHPDDRVRQRAAERLNQLSDADSLLGRVDDTDPKVRVQVALSLGRRSLSVHSFQSTGAITIEKIAVEPELNERRRGVLGRLLQDEEAEVRLAALKSLVSANAVLPLGDVYRSLAQDGSQEVRLELTNLKQAEPDVQSEVLDTLASDVDTQVRLAVAERAAKDMMVVPGVLGRLCTDEDPLVRQRAAESLAQRADVSLSVEQYERLLADPDPLIRKQLANFQHADRQLVSDVLERLALDKDASVRSALNARLMNELQSKSWGRDGPVYLPSLRLRMEHPADPLIFSTGIGPSQSVEGRRAATRWALASDDEQLWMHAVAPAQGKQIPSNWLEAWLGLEDEELVRLIPEVWRRNPKLFYDLTGAIRSNETTARAAVARQLLHDVSKPRELRVLGASSLGGAATEEDVAILLQLMADEDWVAAPPNRDEEMDLRSLCSVLPPGLRERFALQMLDGNVTGEAFADRVTQIVLGGHFMGDVPHDVRVIRAVLDRWYTVDGPRLSCVSRAMQAFASFPESVPPELLIEAIRSPYSFEAVEVMASLRDERYLDTLGECLDASWVKDSSTRDQIRNAAITGLTAFMSDAAAEKLMRAAVATASPTWRALFMQGADTIQRYQDSLHAWETRSVRRATREDTISEVLLLLDDEDGLVRSEAVRALATLGAVEQLPRLIRMLGDDDASVVAAVRKALDKLNTQQVSAGDG